jgi:hypothetical protein
MAKQSLAVQPPKVISGPKIIGHGNSKIDISHVQAYLTSLKHANAAASHSSSSGGLKIHHQSTAGSSGSGSSMVPNLSGIVTSQIYARSTSRGKD